MRNDRGGATLKLEAQAEGVSILLASQGERGSQVEA